MSSTSNSMICFGTTKCYLTSKGCWKYPLSPHPPPIVLERKIRSLQKVMAHLDSLENDGSVLVFTDGSSEELRRIGFIGGYGIFSSLPVML